MKKENISRKRMFSSTNRKEKMSIIKDKIDDAMNSIILNFEFSKW